MPGTWPEALVLLHHLGWSGEMVDGACTALIEACAEGDLEGRQPTSLSTPEVRRVLAEPVRPDEAVALGLVAEIRDHADADGDGLRAALRDLDAFVDDLGEA